MTPTLARLDELRELAAGKGRCGCNRAPCEHDFAGPVAEVLSVLDQERAGRGEELLAWVDLVAAMRDTIRAREAETLAVCAKLATLVVALRNVAPALIAEVRRLRALPVIATCGECGWRGRATSVNSAHLYCQHPADMPRRVDPDAAPPAWCPMRGAR